MKLRPMLMMLCLAISGPVLAGDRDVDGALGKLIEVYGGEENLRRLDSMVQEWDLLALMGNRPGSDVRSIDFGGRLKVELTYPDKQETRILDGDVGIVRLTKVLGDSNEKQSNSTSPDTTRAYYQLVRMNAYIFVIGGHTGIAPTGSVERHEQ